MWRIVAIALVASTPAEAHCYSVWHYNFPQRCGGPRQMVRAEGGHNPTKFREVLSPFAIPNQEHSGNEARLAVTFARQSPSEPVRLVTLDIPLPGLAQADLAEPEADEATRTKVLLRAALELPDAP